jgi:hypothetical protein
MTISEGGRVDGAGCGEGWMLIAASAKPGPWDGKSVQDHVRGYTNRHEQIVSSSPLDATMGHRVLGFVVRLSGDGISGLESLFPSPPGDIV